MSPSSNLSTLLGFIEFGPTQLTEAEALLSKFAALSESEKDAARASTIEKVFPLAFGEDAVIESSPVFDIHYRFHW